MKFSIVLFFILTCYQSNAQSVTGKNDSLVTWNSDTPLKWSDFKASPPDNRINKISITQGYIDIIGVEYYNIPKYKIVTMFKKYGSWTLTDDLKVLKHEQTHFDIFELHARKLRKDFKELNMKKVEDTKVYHAAYQKIVKDCNEMGKKYDSEVYFNDEKQLEWDEFIAKSISELEDFALDNSL